MISEKISEKDIKETALESKSTSRLNAALWYSYDMADTFFSHTIISLTFSPFAMLLGAKLGWTLSFTFIITSIFMASSNLLIAIFGPILGAISDTAGKRKPAVITVAIIMALSTVLMAILDRYYWACCLFVIGNFCYQAGRLFYDSQIPFIAEPKKRTMIQAIGGGLAAFGSLIGTALGFITNVVWEPATVNVNIWELGGGITIEPKFYAGYQYMLGIAAGIFALMTVPYLFHKETINPSKLNTKEKLRNSMNSFKETFKMIFKDRNSTLFFIGYFFIVNAANTTILFMVQVIEGACGITDKVQTYLIIGLGVVLSIVFGILMGKILQKLGPKKTFIVSGVAWILAILFFFFAGLEIYSYYIPTHIIYETAFTIPNWLAFFGAFFVGIGFGSIWIVGRQFVMVLAPPSRIAQYNGFLIIAGRVSAIVAPLIFASMMVLGIDALNWTANHAFRLALGSIIVFFVIGIILLIFIIDPYRKYQQGIRAPYMDLYKKQKIKKIEE